MRKGGMGFAPRTVLQCICWGTRIDYPNGKLSFSYLCPVLDIGMPKGYIASKAAQREALSAMESRDKERSIQQREAKKKVDEIRKSVSRPISAQKNAKKGSKPGVSTVSVNIAAAQLQTKALEDDIAAMEAQLEKIRQARGQS
eukprot:TRINITY_DN5839_c0_g1_i2.p1 TRINITY_DN5839_c0_g1~~TRINITY_DN5839_c0_g1_i2.p1  ORF type:complete len:143 (+),score=17.87 TRINITY_DN5839_c0_g1_i2:273-701(+)